MKILAHWIKPFTIFILFFTQVALSFPDFLHDQNSLLSQISTNLTLRISILKNKVPYTIKDNELKFDYSSKELSCKTGDSLIKLKQSQGKNTFTDTLYIQECGLNIGYLIIKREGKGLTAANPNELLHLRFPPITSEQSYNISFPKQNLNFSYTNQHKGYIELVMIIGKPGRGSMILTYTESTDVNEITRNYKTSFGETLTAKKTRIDDYYELSLFEVENIPLGITGFYDIYDPLASGAIDLADWKLNFLRDENIELL